MVVDLTIGVVKTLQANNLGTQRELERLLRLVEEGSRRAQDAQRLMDAAVSDLMMARSGLPTGLSLSHPATLTRLQAAEDKVRQARNLV